MGISTEFKRWLRKRYPGAWILKPTGDERLIRGKGHPRMPPIVIFDYTYIIKYLTTKGRYGKGGKREDDPINTGHKYFLKQFMPDISEVYSEGAKLVYICFDRGSPPNKSEEHSQRYKSRPKMKTPDNPNKVIIDDATMPSDWSTFIVNRELTRELIHYITKKLLSNKPLSKRVSYIFTPPQNCTLSIHGGRIEKPKRHCNDLDQPPSSRLHSISYDSVELPSSEDGIKREKYVREHNLSAGETDSFREKLLEGEMACLYYHRCHPHTDLYIVSSDGDLLILLLLASKDRIDANTGNFKNNVFLKLRSTQSEHDYIDINALWGNIQTDKYFQQAGISDPVLHICALSCLIKNDYIHNCLHGIRGGVYGRNTENVCPWIIYTFMNNVVKYKEMIKTKFINVRFHTTERGDLNRILEINLDEELFIEFIKDCYVERYKTIGTVKKKYGDNPSHENIRNHLKGGKNENNRMMVNRKIRVLCRKLLWVLTYWLNGYRDNCSFNDPTLTYKGFSYYGWELSGFNACTTVQRVSIPCSDIVGMYKPWSPSPRLQWENRKKTSSNDGNNDNLNDDQQKGKKILKVNQSRKKSFDFLLNPPSSSPQLQDKLVQNNSMKRKNNEELIESHKKPRY